MNALIPQIRVNGRLYTVAHEGLPQICFGCGKYGHIKDRCESETETNDSNRMMTEPTSSKDLPPKTSPETEGAATPQKPLYGPMGNGCKLDIPKKETNQIGERVRD